MNSKLKMLWSVILIFITSMTPTFAQNLSTVASRSTTTINNMDYEMTVAEDHSYIIHVTETLTFHTPHHGIRRSFAKSGTFYRQIEGKDVSSNYTAGISDLQVKSGQPYTTDVDGDAYIIQIGDANRYLSGTQKYEYSFRYDPGDDGIDSMDDVYQNILSQYMEDEIEHINITIKMPKPFDPKNVVFLSGLYGSTDSSNIVSSVDGTTITAHNVKPISPGETLTCRIELPEGYFVGATTGKEYFKYFYIAAAAAIIIGLVIYFIYGRGEKPLEPVTFYPPDDFDSAQVGYVLSSSSKNKYLVSLIIYFADRGWLSIENIGGSDKEAEFVLHKLDDIPLSRPLYERTLFNGLFKRSENPNLNALSGSQSMGTAFLRAKEQLSDWFTGSNRIYSSSSIKSKGLIFLCLLAVGLTFSFASSFFFERSIDLITIIVLGMLSIVGPFVITIASQKREFIIGIGMTVFSNLLLTFFVRSFVMTGILLVTNLILSTLAYNSNRRTEKGLKWYGECLGYRHFIKTAELDQIKLLVEENPTYYYKTLPYAYAMDLTDVWVKNFEGIAMTPPSWYIDPYPNYDLFTYMYFMNAFNHTMTHTINNINTLSMRGMGSGGFGGGFMGGGFGGGGGGGMGGGSW